MGLRADTEDGTLTSYKPSGIGLQHDLLKMVGEYNKGMSSWYGQYIKILKECHMADAGSDGTFEYLGQTYIKPIAFMDGKPLIDDSPHKKLLELLGYGDADFVEYLGIVNNPQVKHVHYTFKANNARSVELEDFNWRINAFKQAFPTVAKINFIAETVKYPEGETIEPVSIKDLGYTADATTISLNQKWVPSFTPTEIEYCPIGNFADSISFLRFLDINDNEITIPWEYEFEYKMMFSFMLNSINTDFLVSEDIHVGTSVGGLVNTNETLVIDWTFMDYDDYSWYLMTGQDLIDYEDGLEVEKPYYINRVWNPLGTGGFGDDDPVNKRLNCYIYIDNRAYLNVNFQRLGSLDEISYLITSYPYIEVEQNRASGNFIRGVIRLLSLFLGAYMIMAKLITDVVVGFAIQAVKMTISAVLLVDGLANMQKMKAVLEMQSQVAIAKIIAEEEDKQNESMAEVTKRIYDVPYENVYDDSGMNPFDHRYTPFEPYSNGSLFN